MLRDVKENPNTLEEQAKATEILEVLNKSNKIMFSEIRDIIKDKWLQRKLTSCSAGLLKYIHGGKMGMQSKLIMLKYFNKILRAIRTP
jgi:enoyl reductase-like protein